MSGEGRQSWERAIRVLKAFPLQLGRHRNTFAHSSLSWGQGDASGFFCFLFFVFFLANGTKGTGVITLSEKSKGRCLCTACHLAWWRGQGWWPSIPEVIATGDAWMFYGQHGHHPREREGPWVVFHPNQKCYLDGWGIISRKFGCPKVEGCVLRWPWVSVWCTYIPIRGRGSPRTTEQPREERATLGLLNGTSGETSPAFSCAPWSPFQDKGEVRGKEVQGRDTKEK